MLTRSGNTHTQSTPSAIYCLDSSSLPVNVSVPIQILNTFPLASKDPSEQGFGDRKYDLILATNVIHATGSLNESLRNVRSLLTLNGRLLLHELTPTSKWITYVWGTLAGW